MNPLEQLLDDTGEIKEFANIQDAVSFLTGISIEKEDIGYSVFIGTEKNPDMVSFSDEGYENLTMKIDTVGAF